MRVVDMPKSRSFQREEIEFTPEELAKALGHKGATVVGFSEDNGKYSVVLERLVASVGPRRKRIHERALNRDEENDDCMFR